MQEIAWKIQENVNKNTKKKNKETNKDLNLVSTNLETVIFQLFGLCLIHDTLIKVMTIIIISNMF